MIGIFGLSRDVTERSSPMSAPSNRPSSSRSWPPSSSSSRSRTSSQVSTTAAASTGSAATPWPAPHATALPLLLFVDLDGLKAINDGFGHAAGDTALRERRRPPCATPCGDTDIVARIGRDEFAAVLVGVTELEAEELCERVRRAANASAPGGAPSFPSASASPRSEQGDVETLDDLIAAADRAMYDGRRMRRRAPARQPAP